MNPLHQLTRRPVKAAFGVLLLALAGAILCLSGGQYWAAAQTRAAVEENYTTVARRMPTPAQRMPLRMEEPEMLPTTVRASRMRLHCSTGPTLRVR